MRGKNLMVMGTASSVGKSVLCSAFLRILKQDGWNVAPFKAQNMALNSYVDANGLEMGRAQVTQAQAAGKEPDVRMNPVLLKPTSDHRSQVMVGGRPIGTMSAVEYHQKKPGLRKMIREIYDDLESSLDCVILEGAGSPAEINLRDGDIVNMAMAEAADAPVILIGDIDLGGVFASLLGTIMLMTEQERDRVKGVIINKFRGDVRLLEPGLRMLEDRIHIPVIGVVPWTDIELEDEDSVTERFQRVCGTGETEIAVIRLPHISNFTDFQALTLQEGIRVRYAASPKELEGADIVILPGTKNTIDDLAWLRTHRLDRAILSHANTGGKVLGICGGYQMLGKKLHDPLHTESVIGEAEGLGLLDMEVTFLSEKRTAQSCGEVVSETGWIAPAKGMLLDGYEIHAGENTFGPDAVPWINIDGRTDGISNATGNVLGTYLHGLFDDGQLSRLLVKRQTDDIGAEKQSAMTMEQFREREFDRLADVVRASVDMEYVYRIIRGEV